MKILIVHPRDKTTDFLKHIYCNLKNVTIIDGNVSKSEIKDLIKCHNRIIFLGHGTTRGLSSLNKFDYKGEYIIDHTFKQLLNKNQENIYLWCDSDKFIQNNNLCGLNFGMFISDLEESKKYGIKNCKKIDIEKSNIYFSKILANCILKSNADIYLILKNKYLTFSKKNKIAAFNVQRIFYK